MRHGKKHTHTQLYINQRVANLPNSRTLNPANYKIKIRIEVSVDAKDFILVQFLDPNGSTPKKKTKTHTDAPLMHVNTNANLKMRISLRKNFTGEFSFIWCAEIPLGHV